MKPELNDSLYKRNLTIIEEIYPQHLPLLTSQSLTDSEYEIIKANNHTYICRIKDSIIQNVDRELDECDIWVHGPDNPWNAAEHSIKSIGWEKQRLFLIVRPGLGYVPFTLYPNLRKGRTAQRMLIVEDRINLFFQSLWIYDWTDVLRSDRTILLLNNNSVQAIVDFFKSNPVAILTPLSVIGGSVWGSQLKRIMQTLQPILNELAQTVHGAAQQYMGELKDHYSAIQNNPAHKTKVLLVEPEHDYLANSISNAFEEEGCQTGRYEGNQRLLRFINPYVWLVYVRENFPDVLLWMNRNTLSPEGVQHLHNFPIKKLLWFLDSPKRVQTTKEELLATDAYFSFDPTYLPYLEQLSGKKGIYLPTAAGIKPLDECQPESTWPQRQGPNIGFVGALAAQRFQAVRDYWNRKDPEFVTILDDIVETHLADPSISLEERYNNSPGHDRLPYSGFVVLYLEERATYLRRLRYLKPLKPHGLVAYGGIEWGNQEWADELTECYSQQTPRYLEDLPSVYYHTLININIFHVQCINSSNPRVYDVLAAGGFLLTEYRPILEDEFEDGRHLAMFHTKDEMMEKVHYYLQHGDEREQIAREGQQYVLNNATYRHRIQKILEEIM